MGVLVSTAIVHVSLVWWWSRRGLYDKAADEAGADEAAGAPEDSFYVLGKAMPDEQVIDMQSQACDIDQILYSSENPALANSPSESLHPYHRLLTQPTKTDKPGLSPYLKRQEDKPEDKPEDKSPDTVTVPLFTSTPADFWTANARHAEEEQLKEERLAQSFCSDVRSDASSSIILSVEKAYEQRNPTWAPKPPKATFSNFKRRARSIC